MAAVSTRTRWIIAGVVVVVLVAGAALTWILWPDAPEPVAEPTETATPTPTPEPEPEPEPEPTEHPEDTSDYDVSSLPAAHVFSVIPELPVDDDPLADTTGLVAHPVADAAPVFAAPGEEPVAQLPREQQFDGTIVPVIEQEEHWVRVLLVGRQGLPGDGDPAQLSGWLRAADVTLSELSHTVEVSIGDGTIDIVGPDGAERVADGFAWGTEATPTPLGRSFIQMTRVTSFSYARGHPLVYLSVQSPTLAGFDGAESAVTAFHYHDVRSGAVSNGCIRVGADTITRLAELPPGTAVYIRE